MILLLELQVAEMQEIMTLIITKKPSGSRHFTLCMWEKGLGFRSCDVLIQNDVVSTEIDSGEILLVEGD